MSDYLWDKTGEPDAEVEQLEQLLGTLAHRPRALELPLAARTEQASRRRVSMTRPSFAAAAALALLLLAGAWLVASRRAATDGQTAHSPAAPAQQNTGKNDANAAGGKERAAGSETEANDGPVRRESKQQPSRQQSAHVAPPRRRRDVVQVSAAPSKKNRNAAAREARPRENLLAAVMERQQSAKAQLVYALRLTGAKLSEVQTKVRGVSEERPAPEERNKIR